MKTAQEKVENLYKDLSDLQEDAANLTIRAPFAGKLQDVKEFQIDQDVSKGTVVATLVNDKQLKLSSTSATPMRTRSLWARAWTCPSPR